MLLGVTAGASVVRGSLEGHDHKQAQVSCTKVRLAASRL